MQDARILLLDEPTSSLDYSNQIIVLETAKELCRNGYTVMLSTHNPEQALAYSSEILALSGSRLVYSGPPTGLLDGAVLSEIYGRKLMIKEIEVEERSRFICLPV